MPSGMFKSGRFRKVFVKTPGGKATIHYRERKPKRAVCGQCKKPLSGVPRERPAIMANLPITMKRPERPYGGVLCSACMRVRVQNAVRGEQ